MDTPGCTIFFILCCLNLVYTTICVHHDEMVEQTHELIEIKKLMAQMTTKISDLDHRMSQLNFLEYAFKVNMVDNHVVAIKQSVANIDARMTRMDTQAEIIKDMLKSISESSGGAPCRAVETENIRTGAASHRIGGDEAHCKELNTKVADYGYKVAKSQQELKDSVRRSQQVLGTLLDMVRTGFQKISQKMDTQHNPDAQLSRLSSSISAISIQLPQTLGNLTTVSQRLVSLQSEVTKVAQTMSGSASTPHHHHSNDNSVSASIIHANELSDKVKVDLESLVQIEPDIVLAKKMANSLLSGQDPRRPTTRETLQNLTKILEKIERTATPLLSSVSYNFGGVHELLETAVESMDKKQATTCNFRDVFKMELKAITDRINERGVCLPHSSGDSEDTQDVSSATKQKDIFENLSYVRSAVMMIKTDLQEIFRQCPDGSMPGVAPV